MVRQKGAACEDRRIYLLLTRNYAILSKRRGLGGKRFPRQSNQLKYWFKLDYPEIILRQPTQNELIKSINALLI